MHRALHLGSRSNTSIAHLSSRYSRFQVPECSPLNSRVQITLAITRSSRAIIINATLHSATTRGLRRYRPIKGASNPLSPGQRLAFCVSASTFCRKEARGSVPSSPEIALVIRAECDSPAHPVITAIFVGGSLKIDCALWIYANAADPRGHRLEI